MREAERNLDAFWHEVDETFFQKLGRKLHDSLHLSPRELERTPEWIPVPKSEVSTSPTELAENFTTFTFDIPSDPDVNRDHR